MQEKALPSRKCSTFSLEKFTLNFENCLDFQIFTDTNQNFLRGDAEVPGGMRTNEKFSQGDAPPTDPALILTHF